MRCFTQRLLRFASPLQPFPACGGERGARAASGHAAAPPSSVMNSRRFMSGMGTSSPMRYQPANRPVRSVFRHLSLPQRGGLVLGADLNCSESRRRPAPQVPPPDQDSTGRFSRLAPPYKISLVLLRSATSCFGCSTNVNESFPLIATALNEDLRLEIDAAAFDIVAYVIAVLLGCQPSCCPFAGVDTQPSHVAILLCGSVSTLTAFLA